MLTVKRGWSGPETTTTPPAHGIPLSSSNTATIELRALRSAFENSHCMLLLPLLGQASFAFKICRLDGHGLPLNPHRWLYRDTRHKARFHGFQPVMTLTRQPW